jgi:hypothetical protein
VRVRCLVCFTLPAREVGCAKPWTPHRSQEWQRMPLASNLGEMHLVRTSWLVSMDLCVLDLDIITLLDEAEMCD